jgi:hypothetical protein
MGLLHGLPLLLHRAPQRCARPLAGVLGLFCSSASSKAMAGFTYCTPTLSLLEKSTLS